MRASVLLVLALLCLSITTVEGKKECKDRKPVKKCIKKGEKQCLKKKKWRKKKCCVTCKNIMNGVVPSDITSANARVECKYLGEGEVTYQQGATPAAAATEGVCGKAPTKYDEVRDIFVVPIKQSPQFPYDPCDSDRTHCYEGATPSKCTASWETTFGEDYNTLGVDGSELVQSGNNLLFGGYSGNFYGYEGATGKLKFKNNYNRIDSCRDGSTWFSTIASTGTFCTKSNGQITSVADGAAYGVMTEVVRSPAEDINDDDGSDDDDSNGGGANFTIPGCSRFTGWCLYVLGTIVKLDPETGVVAWSYANEDMVQRTCGDSREGGGVTFGGRTYWTNVPSPGSKMLYALNSATGEPLWNITFHRYDKTTEAGGFNSFCDNHLHIIGDADSLYAVVNENLGTSTIADGYVSVYKFSFDTSGEPTLVWNVNYSYPVVPKDAKPILDSGNGGQLIITAGINGLGNSTNPAVAACAFAVSTATGRVNWKYDIPVYTGIGPAYSTGNSWMANGQPIVYGDYVYLRTMTLVKEAQYQRSLYALNKLGGQQIFATVVSSGAADIFQTEYLAAADGYVFLADEIDPALVSSANPTAIREKGVLYFYNAATGALTHSRKVDGKIRSGPDAFGGKVYVSHDDKSGKKTNTKVVAFSTNPAVSGCA